MIRAIAICVLLFLMVSLLWGVVSPDAAHQAHRTMIEATSR